MANSNYWVDRQNQRQHQRNFKEQTMSLLEAFAWEISNSIKDTFNKGNRSGLIYKRGTKQHQASAPGEPPVTDSGQLVNSVSAPHKIENGYEVGIDCEYAMYLELGTINMRPRPYLSKSINDAWNKVNK